jgi:DHA3 family macrolide efflux protein-like MFS transporter
MLAIAAIANLLAKLAFALTPILVSKHFGGGALELGWMQSVFGIGFVAGALTLSAWGGFKVLFVPELPMDYNRKRADEQWHKER